MLASIAAAWQAAEQTLESHVETIRAHQAQMLEHELAITENQPTTSSRVKTGRASITRSSMPLMPDRTRSTEDPFPARRHG